MRQPFSSRHKTLLPVILLYVMLSGKAKTPWDARLRRTNVQTGIASKNGKTTLSG